MALRTHLGQTDAGQPGLSFTNTHFTRSFWCPTIKIRVRILGINFRAGNRIIFEGKNFLVLIKITAGAATSTVSAE